MKTISEFEPYADFFILQRHVNKCLAGKLAKVPRLHKMREDKDGNNAIDTYSNLYKIEADEKLIPVF